MTPPLDVFGLSEIIEGFVFREKGGVKILKKWREEAVIMQVDIEIVSVSRPQYLNYGSLPPFGFYGYASLIMRDFSLPSIAITQPRQTLYYAVNEFAQSAWMEFHQMVRLQENFKGIEELVCFNTGLLNGACIAKECKPIPIPSFIEFPLREVLINTHFGTQFNVELSYWKINDVLDNCGNIVSPKSNQTDGDKDDGLPPFGTMPQQAPDSSNPYAGLPPESPWDREGVIALSRLDDLAKPNPDNAPALLYWIEFRAPRKAASFEPSCSVRYSKVIIPIPEANTDFSIHFQSFGVDTCENNEYGNYTFVHAQTQEVLGTAGWFEAFGGVATYGSGEEYPETVYYSPTPV